MMDILFSGVITYNIGKVMNHAYTRPERQHQNRARHQNNCLINIANITHSCSLRSGQVDPILHTRFSAPSFNKLKTSSEQLRNKQSLRRNFMTENLLCNKCRTVYSQVKVSALFCVLNKQKRRQKQRHCKGFQGPTAAHWQPPCLLLDIWHLISRRFESRYIFLMQGFIIYVLYHLFGEFTFYQIQFTQSFILVFEFHLFFFIIIYSPMYEFNSYNN